MPSLPVNQFLPVKNKRSPPGIQAHGEVPSPPDTRLAGCLGELQHIVHCVHLRTEVRNGQSCSVRLAEPLLAVRGPRGGGTYTFEQTLRETVRCQDKKPNAAALVCALEPESQAPCGRPSLCEDCCHSHPPALEGRGPLDRRLSPCMKRVFW